MSLGPCRARHRLSGDRATFRCVRRNPVPLLVALLLSACAGGDSPTRSEPTVRDSAGISVIEYPEALVAPADWTLSLQDAVRAQGEFARVRHGTVFTDGHFVVADGDSRSLRFHASDGALLTAVGRAGGGPGEFQDISSLSRWPGDSLLAWDLQQRRLTVFDARGTMARSFALSTTAEVPFGNVQGAFADGSMLTIGFVAGGGPEPGRTRSQSPVHRFARDGSLDTVYPFVTSGEAFFTLFENGGFSVTSALFARSTTVHAGPSLLVEADNDAFTLRLRTPAGALQRIIRRVGTTPSITPAMRQAVIEYTLGTLASDAARERNRPVYEAMPLPATTPAFGRVHVDRLDHVWVEAYEPVPGATSAWWVFAPEGSLVARATMPQRLTPLEIGADYLLGVHRDELDVEEVVVARLTRQ
jgi:hypothetical protein